MNHRVIDPGVFANPTIGIAVSDHDGRIIEGNAAFCHFVGYDACELASLTVGDLCPGDDRERELHERRQLVAGKLDHLAGRKRYLTRSGKTVWGDTSMTAVRDPAGNCEALVSMVVDVTDQRRQQLLQEGQTHVLEKLYRNRPLEEVGEAIVATIESVEPGLLCSILQLNATTGTLHKVAAPSLPDYYNDAIEGMKIGDGVGSCGTAAFHKRRVVVADILQHPYWAKARRLVEKTPLRACWSQPIFDNDGQVLGTFAIYYTEPREPGRFELELISSAAELTALAINHKKALTALLKSDQLKSEFISTAAHELRTPVSSIMGFAELLLDQTMTGSLRAEQKQDFLNVILENCERLDKIVDDILDVSRIEDGRSIPLDRKPTSIATLLTKVVNRFRLNATHQLELEIKPGTPDAVMLDVHRISQVLDNLLSNAIKYSSNGSTVSIIAEGDDRHCQVVVADQGIGMTQQQIAHIFDKFYRADASNTAVKGLGLGMSIVKQIIADHGGAIWVQSSPGAGCRVYFTLPTDSPEPGQGVLFA
jgi:PAS domain S-box-containing protein